MEIRNLFKGYVVQDPRDIPRGARVFDVRHGHDCYEFIDYKANTHQLIDKDWWAITVLEEIDN